MAENIFRDLLPEEERDFKNQPKLEGYNIFFSLLHKFLNVSKPSVELNLSDSVYLDSFKFDIQGKNNLFLDDKKIQYVLEVENSTNFTSAIQRASNLNSDIPKIMIIPNERINELKKIKDPLFINNFKSHNWKYLEYKNINKINKSTIDKLLKILD